MNRLLRVTEGSDVPPQPCTLLRVFLGRIKLNVAPNVRQPNNPAVHNIPKFAPTVYIGRQPPITWCYFDRRETSLECSVL